MREGEKEGERDSETARQNVYQKKRESESEREKKNVCVCERERETARQNTYLGEDDKRPLQVSEVADTIDEKLRHDGGFSRLRRPTRCT